MKKLWVIWAMLAMVLLNVGKTWALDLTPTGFFYPTGTSNLGAYAGWLASSCNGNSDYLPGSYHIGHDFQANVGDSVYVIAAGTVEYISPNGWGLGNKGILVRHQLSNGNYFLALYGHVQSNVNIGDQLSAAQVIGTIGPWSGGNHLHFGIFPGVNYPSNHLGLMECSSWPDTNGFVDPIEWINTHTPFSQVARFPNGTISQAILSKYNTLASQGHNLGDPWDNGGSAFVHEVNGMWIQDFQDRRDLGGESNGYYHPYTAIFHYDDPWMSRPAWLLKEGFWDYYMNHTGWITFGCPVTDEYLVNSSTWQTFHRFGPNYDNNSEDYQVFYFRWNPDTWVLDVVNQYLQPVLYSELIVTLETASGSTDDASRTQDGVYHSGIHLANFGEPLNLMDQQDYSGFYAMVNQSVIPIDNFSLDGNLSISLQPTVDPPLAAFAVDFSSGEAPHTVQFTDQSAGLVDDWFWTFGDGITSTSQHPSHTYTEAGVYSVSLQVSNQGGVDLLEMADYITVINRVVASDDRPLSFALYHNYPNPFNPQTAISYTLPQTDYVELDVYDISGAKVCSLVSGLQTRGLHQVTWDARDSSGQLLNSGVYFCHLRSGGKIETQKMILLK
jgi:PKD repeat protein